MDILLDVNIMSALCQNLYSTLSTPIFNDQIVLSSESEAISKCKALGGRIWLYAGAISMLHYKIVEYSQSQSSTLSIFEAKQKASQIIKQFARDKHWLAALAPEEDLFDSDDLEQEQLIQALDRFMPGKIRLLTKDTLLLNKCDAAISPDAYLLLNSPDAYLLLNSPDAYLLLNSPDASHLLNSPNASHLLNSPNASPSLNQLAPLNIPIEFNDLKTQQDKIRSKLETNIHRILHHGSYIMGPEINTLETKLANYVGVKHCITASSGTDTLLIAMMALGIGHGDEVITSSFTFIATAEMIALLGAVPVFVDIDPRTFNIDPLKIEKAITPKTKAIMPVSLYGQCADFDAINLIADKYNLPVIEDGAQSFGATYKGKKSSALSLIGSTSFFPSKPLGAYGDGGALFTNDDELAKTMRQIRVHGQDKRYHHNRLGINGRLDTLQAGVLLAKLERFDEEIETKQKIAMKYSELLGQSCPSLTLPYIEPYNTSVFAQYTVQYNERIWVDCREIRTCVSDKNLVDDSIVNHRDKFIASIKKAGIPIAVHYPFPLHKQPVFEIYRSKNVFRDQKLKLSVAEKIADIVFSLPMSPYLRLEEQTMIVKIIAEIINIKC